ncbi:ABC transporter permease subunit [Isoptericola halotolerans]|uniref:ABC transporter permease n=1 Tax=Isoptericola halotolerans TaxID=300560 RepID=UPI00388E9349
MNRWVRDVGGAVLVATVVALLAVPLLPVLLWAAADRWSFPAVLPQVWGFGGWSDALAAGLPAALARSTALGLAVAAVATPPGVLIGMVLGWRLGHRPRLLVTVLLVPLILPPFAVAMGLDVILIRAGLPGTVAVVLVLAAFALPYTSYTSATGFARISPQLDEQARALGATPRQAHTRVVLPAIRGSILVAALLAFLVGWSDYVVTVLIGGGQLITAPVLLGAAAAGSGNEPITAALALAALVPPVLLVTAAAAARRVGRPRRTTPDLDPAPERTRR